MGNTLVYDCFTFFNELDLLDLRLHELNNAVDYFVLVEATRTHSNQEKPLFFNENKNRFKDFLPKIIHIVVDDFPSNPKDRWVLENFQRDAIMRGLENCNPNDSIIISDIDEIVSSNAVTKYKDRLGIKFFRQKMYYYYFNCQAIDITWKPAKMIRYKDLKSPQWLRVYPAPLSKSTRKMVKLANLKHKIRRIIGLDTHITNGGWHFSYLGGVDRIKNKINSFAHEEYDNDLFTNDKKLLDAIEKGEDIFGRKNMTFRFVTIDKTFPNYLLQNKKKFSHMVRN